MEKTDFGVRIKILRNERELTMDMLVEDIRLRYSVNINKGLLSRWERQEVEPTLAYAKIMADYFGVSLDYLIGLTDIRTPSRLLAKPGHRQVQAQIRKKEDNVG